ncbi:MAG: hypothetical protein NT069_01835 [Planctomycetota bacterium]|nr:hypothetical protein [Planctomycetota bacterium]
MAETKYGYLVVEGPHDVEFAACLLAPFGLKRVHSENKLTGPLRKLVPHTFPHGGDLLKRVPVPLFLRSESHLLAIHSAFGDSRLAETLELSRAAIETGFDELIGVGVVLDSDREMLASKRYATLCDAMSVKRFAFPRSPGEFTAGTPRFGAFVLPDNKEPGNLEDLLIESAGRTYPNLLASARVHVVNAKNDPSLNPPDSEDLEKTPIENKAIVSAIASVLRPGKAIQTSIQDNQWFKGDMLKLPRVEAVQKFLATLFELPDPPS